ncbi:MAG: hypothetical protein RMZ42_17070, partial [Nostoc sp. DedQUE05]|uniref:hypothetical protein n=1 Tax=Nostoc sp. DedQUE05 TaxID=3075391 RepID=UPI002AD468DE
EITNEYSEITNEYSKITNEYSKITNEYPEITNEYSKITNEYSEITNCSGLRKIGIARRAAKDTEEEENRYAQCYACVKMRKSCVSD